MTKAMSIQCNQCGASNPDDSLFCQKCGRRLDTLAQQAAQVMPVNRPQITHNGVVLSSPAPYPDKLSNWQAIYLLFAIGGFWAIIRTNDPNTSFFNHVAGCILLSAFCMFAFYQLLTFWSKIKINKLLEIQYRLPKSIEDSAIISKVAFQFLSMSMNVDVNPDVGGLKVLSGDNVYYVIIDRSKSIFTIRMQIPGGLDHYTHMIQDVPKIVYVIQQCLMKDK